MPHYELLLSHDFTLDEPLAVGDAFRYQGTVWRVEKVEPHDLADARVWLGNWPNEMPLPPEVHGESEGPYVI